MHGINPAQITEAILAFVVLLFSLTVHELAHAWTADRLGDPTGRLLGRVSLNPMVHADPFGTILFPLLALVGGLPVIGWAKPVPVNVRRLRRQRNDFVLVALAGPVSNLALAVLAAFVVRLLLPGHSALVGSMDPVPSSRTALAAVATIAYLAFDLNLLLAVFNLIPIPPLDGGNVLSGLLPRAATAAFDLVRPYGFVLLYVLMFTGTLGRIVMPPYYFLRAWLL